MQALTLGAPSMWRNDVAYVGYCLAEAIELRDEPFSVIEKRKPPRLFLKQWHADVAYYRSLPKKEEVSI